MMHQTEDLIQLALDSSTTADESSELARRLENDPVARETEAELREVIASLESTPVVEPPSTLRERIMEAVRQSVPVTTVPFPARPRSTRRFEVLRLAAALAGGVLLGVLFTSELSDVSLDQNQLTGTMSAPMVKTPSPQDLPAAIPFSAGTLAGEIRTIESDHGITLDLTFSSDDFRDVIVSFDSSRARFRGMNRDDEGATELTASPGLLTMYSEGPQRFALEFETEADPALEVTIQQNGQTIFGVSVVGEEKF